MKFTPLTDIATAIAKKEKSAMMVQKEKKKLKAHRTNRRTKRTKPSPSIETDIKTKITNRTTHKK